MKTNSYKELLKHNKKDLSYNLESYKEIKKYEVEKEWEEEKERISEAAEAMFVLLFLSIGILSLLILFL